MPTVASVSPGNGESWIYRNRPAVVRLQRSDSTNLTTLEATQGDFDAGTLTSVLSRPSGLRLLNQTIDDFESDTIGQLPAGCDVQYGSGFTVQSSGGSKWVKHAPASAVVSALRWTAMGQIADPDFKAKWKVDSVAADPGVAVRLSGGSGTENCYVLQPAGDGAKFRLYKRVNGGITQLGSDISFAYTTSTEYWMRVQAGGTTIRGKVWAASGAEPESWNVTVTDSALTNGYVGLCGYTTTVKWFDLATILGVGTPYPATGNRVSPAYSLAAVAVVGGTWIEWTADVPANTTLTIEASVDGSTWYACTNGAPIPTILQEGANVAGASLYLRETLATTNTSITPTLSALTVTFRPVEPRSVEILVNGVSHTVANGGFSYWNTAKVSGGAVVDWHQDVWFVTLKPWWDQTRATITLVVKYKGSTISTTTFMTAEQETLWAQGYSSWMSLALGGAYDGPMAGCFHFFVSTIEPWLVSGEAYYYVQSLPRCSADAYYWVAHMVVWDGPAAAIVGHPAVADGPAALVVEGWARTDGPAAVVVQGYIRSDGPAAVIAAIPFRTDGPAAAIVGREIKNDGPAAAVAYQVNRRTTLDVKVISEETAAALAQLGITVD